MTRIFSSASAWPRSNASDLSRPSKISRSLLETASLSARISLSFLFSASRRSKNSRLETAPPPLAVCCRRVFSSSSSRCLRSASASASSWMWAIFSLAAAISRSSSAIRLVARSASPRSRLSSASFCGATDGAGTRMLWRDPGGGRVGKESWPLSWAPLKSRVCGASLATGASWSIPNADSVKASTSASTLPPALAGGGYPDVGLSEAGGWLASAAPPIVPSSMSMPPPPISSSMTMPSDSPLASTSTSSMRTKVRMCCRSSPNAMGLWT